MVLRGKPGNKFWLLPFTVPPEVNSLGIEVYGRGGDGSAATATRPGAGGGGAGYRRATAPVTPGSTILYAVGTSETPTIVMGMNRATGKAFYIAASPGRNAQGRRGGRGGSSDSNLDGSLPVNGQDGASVNVKSESSGAGGGTFGFNGGLSSTAAAHDGFGYGSGGSGGVKSRKRDSHPLRLGTRHRSMGKGARAIIIITFFKNQ